MSVTLRLPKVIATDWNTGMIDIQSYDNEALEALADLWLASWRSTGISVAGQTTRQELRDRIPRELAADWTVYLAYEEGALVGFVALRVGAAAFMNARDWFWSAPENTGLLACRR